MHDADASSVAQRLREAMLVGDPGGIAATLAEDVLFYSPAFAEPTRGRETVAGVLTVAKQVYGRMDFGETLTEGSTAAMFFEAEVDGHRLQVCYRLQVSAGRVARLDALVRPLEAAQALVSAMMRRTAAKRPE